VLHHAMTEIYFVNKISVQVIDACEVRRRAACQAKAADGCKVVKSGSVTFMAISFDLDSWPVATLDRRTDLGSVGHTGFGTR